MKARALAIVSLFLVGCAPSTPASFPEPTEDPSAPPPPSAPERTTNHVWKDSALTCDAKRSAVLRLRFEDDDTPAERGALLGISAPAHPERPRVRNHVRRLPAKSADSSLAKAIDDGPYDTTRCAQHEGTAAEIGVDITVEDGAVIKVSTPARADGALTRCLLEVACDLPVPTRAAATHATIPLRVHSMKDGAPKLEVVSISGAPPKRTSFTMPADANESRENDAAILGGVVREAAMACEQGQLLFPAPRTAVFAVSASPHSTVQPTVNVALGPTSEPAPDKPLLHCMRVRMEGFRLPLSPWHGIGTTGYRVMWDG